MVIGDIIGEGASQEESVAGDTPNLAARLEALAPPNSIVVSLSTYELGLLSERWQQIKDGEGHMVLLSGEAGIGKSRILAEFRDLISSEAYTCLRYQCSPHHANSAFYPMIRQ